MTRKQRERLYLKAADRIANRKEEYCCNALERLTNYKVFCDKTTFPELFLFKNRRRQSEGAWWDYLGVEFSPRVLALLFAAEMCKDSKNK